MPWKEETVERQRRTFVMRTREDGCNFSQLCREYGISRKTGYKWVGKFNAGESLSDRSCAPLCRPHKTPTETEELILSMRSKHPTWGPRKILRRLTDNGYEELPALSTTAAILKRNGFVTPEDSAAHAPLKRFVRETPNDLWQMDFKGHFAMDDTNRCHPLTIQDDHSRYLLCLDARDNERWESVKPSLERIFAEYGLPQSILCDNGKPWGDNRNGHTLFELWMMQLDILPIHGRPMHPQTQGKKERFHRTLNEDVISRIAMRDLSHAQAVFDRYRVEFNTERPHDALGLDVPAQHYKVSKKKMPEKLCEPEYNTGKTLRKVNYKGYISIRQHRYYFSENFIGKYLEVLPMEDDLVALCYGNFIVCKIDLSEQLIVSRKIYRR